MLFNLSKDDSAHEDESKHIAPLLSLDRVGVIILGGGEGKRLEPLTKTRCKPAVSFGGRYNLIDVPISHALTSGLGKIFVVAQYLAHTLEDHLSKTYRHHKLVQYPIQLFVPGHQEGKRVSYEGTADAVRKNLELLSQEEVDYFLILSGDQLYNINFEKMISYAMQMDSSLLIAAQPVNEKNANRMGLMKLEYGKSRLVDFYEKPTEREVLNRFYTDEFTFFSLGIEETTNKPYLGSMGIYLFKKQVLFDLLAEDHRADFGEHLICTQMKKGNVHAFIYDGYWEDIGTIESYYHANLALTMLDKGDKHGLKCYDEQKLIFTQSHHLPGAKIGDCRLNRALLCEGSVIQAKEITRSVVGVRSLIGKNSVIRDTVILGNDHYQNCAVDSSPPFLGIGENCHIEKAIIDENVRIGNNVKLLNQAGHVDYASSDGKVMVRDGIIIIPRGAVLPDNFVF